MDDGGVRNALVISIIFLFVGVAVVPSVNSSVVKTSDDLIEVTSQACGIQGYGNTSVKLTREQYQNLEQYLVEFRARLNQTSTREEAIPIFKEAMVELDKYGLLPKGMSVNRAFKLLTKINDQRLKVLDSLELDPDTNYFCLISGLTTVTSSLGPLNVLTQRSLVYLLRHQDIAEFLENLYDNLRNWLDSSNHLILLGLLVFGNIILSFNFLFGGFLTTFLPFGLFSLLTFGRIDYDMIGNYEIYPSSGWVSSIGLNGLKKYEGSALWGEATNESFWVGLFSENYPGVIGFTGLKLTPMTDNFDKTFFLGSALKVKLGTEFLG